MTYNRGWAGGKAVGWVVGGEWVAGGRLYLHLDTEINAVSTISESIHRIDQDSCVEQSDTIPFLVNAINWPHRSCSAPWWLDRVSIKLSVKADLAIYSCIFVCRFNIQQ